MYIIYVEIHIKQNAPNERDIVEKKIEYQSQEPGLAVG